MKILQVSNFLALVRGGSAEVPLKLSRALAERGHDVTVFTSRHELDRDSLPEAGFKVKSFRSLLYVATFDITPGMVAAARSDTATFDILHLHNYRTFQNIVAHHYARKYGVPYVLQAHGSLATYFQKGLLKKKFDFLWGKQILQDAARVFAVTEAEAAQYRSLGVGAHKMEIVPHGVDLAEFNPPPDAGEFREKYRLPTGVPIVLFLGRIHRMKGLDLLARAFAEVASVRSDAALVITGPDDGYLSGLKKLVGELGISEKVVFTGPLYGPEKTAAYAASTVYVLPSSYEIFGITILEAWACGKPVIVTDRCGLADAVRDGAGLVVPYDKDRLRGAIMEMLDNAPARESYGHRGSKLVEKLYNWSNIAHRVEAIYQDVIAKRKQGAAHG
jgi:glycosyltransferase involved in cell wall biosynthesis